MSGRFLLTEAAGSLGDLGTFIPLTVGMVQIAGLDAASIFVFAGRMNLVACPFGGMPLCHGSGGYQLTSRSPR